MPLVTISGAELPLTGTNYAGIALRMEIFRNNDNSGVNVAGNNEQLYGQLMLVKRGAAGAGSNTYDNSTTCSANAYANGALVYSAVNIPYDFRASSGLAATGTIQLLWGGYFTVAHDPDGTKTMSYSGAWGGDASLGSRSVAGSVVLPKITAVPNTPTSVTAVRVSDAQATVSWAQSQPSNGQPTANVVQRRINGGAWVAAATVSPTTSATLAASGNQKLEYRVAAENAAGTSAYSSGSAAIYTTPAAPTGVTAAKNVSLNIVVSWTPNVAFTEHQHVVQESTDGGLTWGSTLATLSAGTSTWTHTSPNPALTHRYRVAAVNTSGGLSSAWVQSGTVQLLTAPNKPTVPALNPFQPRASAFVFPWVHNPVNTTSQSAYESAYSTNGGGSWTSTGKTTSTASSRSYTGGTWSANQVVAFRVRTWGQATSGGSDGTGASPWSDVVSVTFKTAPVASVVSPSTGSTYTAADLTVQVGFSQAEGATFVQATVLLKLGATVLETVNSGSLSGISFVTPVADGGTYSVTATVLDSNGLTSAAVVSTFDVAYTLPVEAVVSVTYLPEQGVTQLDLEFPTPGVGEATAAAVTITRAVDGGDPEPIITGYTITDSLLTVLDTTPTIHGINTYMVRTISADGAIADVAEVVVTDEPGWAFLSTGEGFGVVVSFRGDLKFGSEPGRASALVAAAGRKSPIALFGVQESLVVSGSATIFPDEGSTWQEIEQFLRTAGIVCYRDPSGQRIFGQVSGQVAVPSSLWQQFTYRVVEAT